LVRSQLKPILDDAPISPHATVEGWVLMDVPESYDSCPRPLRYRVTVKDTASKKIVQVCQGPSNEENVGIQRGFSVGQEVDIGRYSVKHFADSM